MQSLIRVALAILLLACAPHWATADVIYSIVDYPADQVGNTGNQFQGTQFHVSGTITTDGVIGPLAAGYWNSNGSVFVPVGSFPPSDITAFHFTIKDAMGNVVASADSHEPGATLAVEGLTATATQLLLPQNPDPSLPKVEVLELNFGNPGNPSGLGYNRGYIGHIPADANHYFATSAPPTAAPIWGNFSPSMGGTDPWVTAQVAVPEPSALVLLSILGVLSAAVCGRRWIRRA